MHISFKELRNIKHSLPTGSVAKIASQLEIEEQTVRNFFGAKKFDNGQSTGWHLQPGPDGGIMDIKDTTILEAAKKIIQSSDAGQRGNDSSQN